MNTFKLTIIASVLFASGCSMAPDYKTPTVPLNQVYTHAKSAQGVVQSSEFENTWWHGFNDEQLNSLVSAAQTQNVSLKIAAERINAASSYRDAVASYKIPSISMNAGFVDMRLSENEDLMGAAVSGVTLPGSLGGASVQLMDRDPNDFFVGLNVSWELDLFGRIESMSEAASIRAEQAEIMRQAVNTAITADVINNYLQYLGASERINIAKANVADQTQSLKLVTSLFEHGYGSELDIANAKAMLASTKSALQPLETAQQVHLNRLAILLGESVHKTKARLGDKALPQMHNLVPTGLPSQLLTRRPDIALAEREIAAKNQEVGAAIAAKYPSIYLTGSPSFVASDFGDLFESDSTSWTLGAGISWNVFDAGRSQAMIEIQEAGFKESVLSYQQAVNQAFNEVETTLVAYGNAQTFYKNVLEASEHAQVAVDKAQSLYKAGLINHLAVLDAQRQKNQLADAEVVARLNTATNLVVLHKALGGDWELKESIVAAN